VPVCRNCGKEIEEGKNYCPQCGPAVEDRVNRLMETSQRYNYRSPARGYNRTLIIAMLCLTVVVVAVFVGIVLSIPTGPEYTKKVQAAVCRANMRDIERSIERYFAANKKYPPTGRVDHRHPIITDGYLETPLQCPSTHHYYLIESDGSGVSVKCDSGLPGHRL
jgi:Tfp pilus assembly protein PilE